jgi:predicted RNA-binding protein associated with RNAse of E/G family
MGMLQHSDPLYAAVSLAPTVKNFGIVKRYQANNQKEEYYPDEGYGRKSTTKRAHASFTD